MKKIISVVMSVVMIAVIVLGMTGCGKEKDKELIGKWEITLNLFEISGPIFEDDKFGEYIEADEFIVTLCYEFGRKGTYKCYAQEDQLKAAVEIVKAELQSGFEDYFEAYIEEKELDMTVEELLEASDMSMDSLIDSMFGEKIVQELIDDFEVEGQYYVKEGMIYMSNSTETEPSEEKGQKYEISGKELTIYAPEGEEDTKVYPMVLKSGK